MKALDLTNQTFGELSPIKVVQTGSKRIWRCKCSCGEMVDYPTFQLTNGIAKKCKNRKNHLKIKPGSIFGSLVVLDFERDSKNQRWLAICKCECGNVKNVSTRNLQRGATTHCGCIVKKRKNKLAPGVAALNKLLSNYKHNAKTKKLEFNLSDEDCIVLFQSPCNYCGAQPAQIARAKHSDGTFIYNGIDRIDNSKGYINGNVQACCTRCNYLKSNTPHAEFLEHVTKIYTHVHNL